MFAASPMQPAGEPQVKTTKLDSPGPMPPMPPAPQGPGEFTRMFAAPALPKQPLPVASPPQAHGAEANPFAPPTSPMAKPMVAPSPMQAPSPFGAGGGFSEFGGGLPQAGMPPGGAAIPPRPFAGPAQPTVQDEYQKLFGGGTPAPAAPQQQRPQPSPFGGATQAFQAVQQPMATPMGQPQQPAQSEYTRMFQQPVPQAPAPPQAPEQTPLGPSAPMGGSLRPLPKQSAKWPLYAVGGLLLVILIGLLITFLRK